ATLSAAPRGRRRMSRGGTRGWTAACIVVGCIAGMIGCSDSPKGNVAEVTYTPIPAGYDYPTDPAKLLAAVDAGDRQRLREHGWPVWAGPSAPSGQLSDGKELPVWETWFTPDELYADDPTACVLGDQPRPMRRHLEVPRQVGDFAKRTPASVVAAFNRYDL